MAFMLQNNVHTSKDPNGHWKGGCWMASLSLECSIWNQATIMHKIHMFISRTFSVYGWVVNYISVTKSCSAKGKDS